MAFVAAHYKTDPGRTDLKNYLDMLDNDLREALEISPTEKYEMRIRPGGWRNELQKAFTMTYMAYMAWSDMVADDLQ